MFSVIVPVRGQVGPARVVRGLLRRGRRGLPCRSSCVARSLRREGGVIQPAELAPIPGRGFCCVAAGCFWGVEEELRRLPGVCDVIVGYTGGDAAAEPTLCQGDTGKK